MLLRYLYPRNLKSWPMEPRENPRVCVIATPGFWRAPLANFSSFLGIIVLGCCLLSTAFGADSLYLRDNLMKAKPGDYIVTAQGQHYTLLLIRDKAKTSLTLEEITVPGERFPREKFDSWRRWIEQGAPNHTSWVAYQIEPSTGRMLEFFSYTKNGWCDISEAENFLGTLLNLRLQRMKDSLRRRVGPPPREHETDQRPFWNPKVVVEGKEVPGVAFDAWRTRWIKDDSELSGKMIDIYLPKQGNQYLSYFPYWLQVSGLVGKAKVRMIDSGFGLQSPKSGIPPRPAQFK